MKYEAYQNSAKRHLETCKALNKALQDKIADTQKKQLRKNILYVAGYVLETGLKYAIFNLYKDNKKWKRKDNIETHPNYSGADSNENCLKSHNIAKLMDFLTSDEVKSDIDRSVFFWSGPDAIARALADWRIEWRYELNRADLDNIDFDILISKLDLFLQKMQQLK